MREAGINMESIEMSSITAAGNLDYNIVTFSWDLLDVCNYKCSYCSAKEFNKHTFIGNKLYLNAWKQVIKLLNMHRLRTEFTLELLGGEPSLHPDIVEIINKVCRIENCRQIELTTNLSKSESFFRSLDIHDNNKLDIVASYHPEYYKETFFNKIVNLQSCDYITVTPLINLSPDKNTWSKTTDLIHKFIDNGVSVGCNLLHEFPGNDFKPVYTTEFWDIFEPLIKKYEIDEGIQLSKRERLTPEVVCEYHANPMPEQSSAFLSTHRDIIEYNNQPGIITRSRWFNINGKATRLNDIDIYKHRLYHYKGWSCRQLMWKIKMDGTIVNSCTGEVLSPMHLTKSNLTACVTCPVDVCDCNTKYQYIKKR